MSRVFVLRNNRQTGWVAARRVGDVIDRSTILPGGVAEVEKARAAAIDMFPDAEVLVPSLGES